MSNLTRFKHLKIAVGIPSNGVWMTDFAISYCNMILYFDNYRVEEYKSQMLQTISTKGSILPKQRMEVVKQALDLQMDYLLWLDSDHTFPKNLIHRLVHHDRDVVGVNCVVKRIPSVPTARYKPTDAKDVATSKPVFSDESSPELEKVWRLGCGIMLVNMRVYKKIGHKVFHMFYRDDVETYQGEDWSMCEAMENAGFDIWVDHPLSLRCGHVGHYEFNHDVVGEVVKQPLVERDNVGIANAQAA